MARYPALISHEDGSDYAVSFPDLPGCVAAAASAEEAFRIAEEALAFHLEGLSEDGIALPSPRSLDDLIGNDAFAGGVLIVVTARPPKAPAMRVNITLDKNLLAEIDETATSAGMTRSGFLADAARRVMQR